MRSRALTISTLILVIVSIVSQSCDSKLNIDEPKRFYKLIGSDGDQFGIDLVGDSDNNIYVLGNSTTTSNGIQVYVVKTSSKGEVIWEKLLGDKGDEQAKDIEITNDGNLIVVADRADISSDENDFVIYRLSATDGSLVGTPTIGGAPGVVDHVSSITETSDGFVVAAYSDNGVFKTGNVFRYNASMVLFPNSWATTISQTSQTGGYNVVPIKSIQINDNLFYTFGYTNTTLGADLIADYNFFIYVSSALNGELNTFIIPGPDPNSDERLTSVRPVPVQSGGGFVLAGYVSNPGLNLQDLYVLKVVQDLTSIQPSETDKYLVGAPRTVTSELSSISSASNATIFPSKGEGFILLGDRNSTGNEDIYLKKINNTLADSWQDPNNFYTFGGDGNDVSGAVIETTDGRILLCGTMVLGNAIGQKKIVLINLNPVGLFDE